MDKISSFQITRLELSGFKCFEEPVSFTFGEITNILGSNHVGKSSVADAIAFAVTGATFSGETRIDRMYNENDPSIEIRMDFFDQNGVSHQLSRSRKKDKMSVTLDGYKVTQNHLNELFGDRDTFLSIFNPLYFIEVLGEDGQKLLERYLPFVEQEAVLSELSEFNRSLLDGQQLLSPDTYMAELRSQIRDLNDAITGYESQSVLLMKQRRETSESLTALRMRKDAVSKEIASLTNAKHEGLNLKGLREEQDDLRLRYDEALSDKPKMPDTAQLDRRISEAAAALEKLNAGAYESKFQDALLKVGGELKAAYQKHADVSKSGKGLQPGQECPLCRQKVTEPAAKALRERVQKQLAEIVAQGRALKEQLEELKELDRQAKEKWAQFRQEDAQKARMTIETLQSERVRLMDEHRRAQEDFEQTCRGLSDQIQRIEEQLDFGNLTVEQHRRLESLEQELRQINADYAAQEVFYSQQTDTTGEKIEAAKKEIQKKKLLLSAAADYAAKRAELTFESLAAGPVRIKLYEVLKTTGEVKDVFRFTYQGRDYRRLSRSEKMLAGIQTSEMVKRLTGRNYPVFIDDAESIANLTRPSGQAIVSRVVPNAPLSVRPVIQEVPLKKAG